MARKKVLNAKEPVRLRFKQLKDGSKSIYLDIYANGKRGYDFLKLYLVPERTHADRLQNEQTMRAANAIKAQRIIEYANGAAGIATKQGGKILLAEWVQNCGQKKTLANTKRAYTNTYNVLMQFAPNARLADIDREFCLRFMHFLLNDCKVYNNKNNKPLAQQSARHYYAVFVSTLNAAARAGLITRNPNEQITTSEKIKTVEAQRCYLTAEELQAIMNAQPLSPGAAATKQAFLFSCFCGLRVSDIERLTWDDIKTTAGQMQIEITMQKTQEPLYIPISKQAQAYLPERQGGKVFTLATSHSVNKHVQQLAAAAGITKHVTFHTARHTFATLLLTKGADLYTTSKLLGHTDISTTQIYAKIVDAKKREAVELLNSVFEQ